MNVGKILGQLDSNTAAAVMSLRNSASKAATTGKNFRTQTNSNNIITVKKALKKATDKDVKELLEQTLKIAK